VTIVIDPTDARSIRALDVLATAPDWLATRVRREDGSAVKAYAIPSQSRPSLRHLADCRACTCEDYLRRGVPCKHVLAVRLHVARLKGPIAPRLCRQCGGRLPPTLVATTCEDCRPF
jgi:hypothetical protein